MSPYLRIRVDRWKALATFVSESKSPAPVFEAGTGVGCCEHKLSVSSRGHGCGRYSQRGDLVVRLVLGGLCRRLSRDPSTRRLAEGARTRQAVSSRAYFLRCQCHSRHSEPNILTRTKVIASIIPKWIPWHYFWAYFVGACFILAAFSLVTRIQARLAASLVALTMFLFVAMMYIPATLRHPENRIFLTIAMRETSFSGGALCDGRQPSAAPWRNRAARIMATVARYFVAIPVLFFSYQQFRHGDHVPAVPLEPLTPTYVLGHAIWTYVAAVAYAVAGVLLLIGKKTRAAATWLGLTVLFVELVVYVPIAVVERASLDKGLNYMADTLMFCGAVLLLAGAMPRSDEV